MSEGLSTSTILTLIEEVDGELAPKGESTGGVERFLSGLASVRAFVEEQVSQQREERKASWSELGRPVDLSRVSLKSKDSPRLRKNKLRDQLEAEGWIEQQSKAWHLTAKGCSSTPEGESGEAVEELRGVAEARHEADAQALREKLESAEPPTSQDVLFTKKDVGLHRAADRALYQHLVRAGVIEPRSKAKSPKLKFTKQGELFAGAEADIREFAEKHRALDHVRGLSSKLDELTGSCVRDASAAVERVQQETAAARRAVKALCGTLSESLEGDLARGLVESLEAQTRGRIEAFERETSAKLQALLSRAERAANQCKGLLEQAKTPPRPTRTLATERPTPKPATNMPDPRSDSGGSDRRAQVEDAIKAGYRELCHYVEFKSGLVEIPRLYTEARAVQRDLSREEFATELKRIVLAQSDAQLHVCNDPSRVPEPEHGIREEGRLFYYFGWRSAR